MSGSLHLRDNKGCEFQIAMMFAVTHQASGSLLRRHQSAIGNKVTPNGVRIVKIQNALSEVGAVVEKEIEVAFIRTLIQNLDQPSILLLAGLNLIAINFPVV